MKADFQLQADAPPVPPPVVAHVFMDELTPCVRNRNWKWDQSCHLFAEVDQLEALHAVARQLGLKREWFQWKAHRMPHYDLNPTTHARAKALGVRQLDRWDTVEFIRRWREHLKS